MHLHSHTTLLIFEIYFYLLFFKNVLWMFCLYVCRVYAVPEECWVPVGQELRRVVNNHVGAGNLRRSQCSLTVEPSLQPGLIASLLFITLVLVCEQASLPAEPSC